MNLQLERPLIFFDLETTGTNVMEDRIVEISVVKIMPDGTKEEKTRRVNPERHIPEAATAVHHITDEDVVGEPTFRQIANSMLKFFEGCDIAGFNSNRFDVPLLIEEFNRAGLAFPPAGGASRAPLYRRAEYLPQAGTAHPCGRLPLLLRQGT